MLQVLVACVIQATDRQAERIGPRRQKRDRQEQEQCAARASAVFPWSNFGPQLTEVCPRSQAVSALSEALGHGLDK